MEAARRSSDVLTSGSATYVGRTHAADQAGNLYSGEIDVVVRFTGMAVHGLVKRLVRADTQKSWTYGLGGEVTGIYLPTAKLDRRGRWAANGRGNDLGRLEFVSRAGGSPDEDLSAGSTFSGQLLGRGEQAGAEAIGTWKVLVGSAVLAGGFGASRGLDLARPGAADTDDLGKIGKTGNTWARLEIGPTPALPALADDTATADVNEKRPAVPVSTVINTANTKFQYNPPVVDDPGGAEFVTGNYEPQRAAVLEDPEFEQTRGNWVAAARDGIKQKLAQLRRSIDLDNADADSAERKFANDQRQRLFDEIQAEIMKVFGPGRAGVDAVTDDPLTQNVDESVDAVEEIYTGVLTRDAGEGLGGTDAWTDHTDYPVNSAGVAQDAEVLAQIEDVLDALGDADAFSAAFDSGGLFADVKSASEPPIDPYPSAAAMFDRPRGKLQIVSAHTDYTRFGAWSHQVSAHAATALSTQTYDRANRGPELGVFAYSPLDPTAAYSSPTHRLYPASGATSNVSATYAGETVATQGDLFYRGDVEATAFWNPADVESSAVVVTISDLVESESGEPLQFGYNPEGLADEVAGVVDVESLTWEAEVTQNGAVKFSKKAEVDLKVGIDTVSGEPTFRPAYGPYRTLTAAERIIYGPGIDRNTGVFNSNTHELRIEPDPNSHWRMAIGGGTPSDPFGELTFKSLWRSGGVVITDNADAAYIAAKAQFDAGVKALIYPQWIVSGIRVEDTGGAPPGNGTRHILILVFADGSTAMMDQEFKLSNNAAMIGTAANPLSGYRAARYPGRPYLHTRPDLVYNEYAHPWSTKVLPTADGGGQTDGSTIGFDLGLGHPSKTLAQLATDFINAGRYVNITESQKAAALAGTLDGMFVGQDQQGPLGLIGGWSLTGGAFGLGAERGVIRGAFGADIQP